MVKKVQKAKKDIIKKNDATATVSTCHKRGDKVPKILMVKEKGGFEGEWV